MTLFRAKNKSGKWVYGIPLNFEDGKTRMIKAGKGNNVSKVEIVPETIGQFTGAYDAHNNMIYEGDIVKDAIGVTHTVIYGQCQYGFLSNFPQKEGHIIPEVIVVGNDYDQPELGLSEEL